VILRPKSPNRSCRFWDPNWENPPSPWFWGSNKKPTAGFEAKPGETVATSFEAKPEKTVATGFEAKQEKPVVTDFEAKPPETIAVGFEAKPPETVTTGFEFKPSEWFWVQTTHKPSTLVLRLNQKTHALRLHVHGVDYT
jgi:hypothetical protein